MRTDELSDVLTRLAQGHTWTWSTSARALLERVEGNGGLTQHPAATVAELTSNDLASLVADEAFVAAARLEMPSSRWTDGDADTPDIAYFSPEFGISELVPQYSGGLGILAGDHLKAANDLGLDLCGVGLFYRQGFFTQVVTDGAQAERYQRYTPEGLGGTDTGITVTVPFPGRTVAAAVWRLQVGAVPLLLLDTDVDPNSAADRAITDRLYSGDRLHRLEQELVLGIGGARALQGMGWNVGVHHLNEGHAGFLLFELFDRCIAAGSTPAEAAAEVKPGLVFTTHTPVPAGIDRFEPELISPYLAHWAEAWAVEVDDLLALGVAPDDTTPAFNMAALCLRSAGRANGVSQLHGRVSRNLFAAVPGGDRITSITNGVHARTWVMPELQDLLDGSLGPGWSDGDAESWAAVDNIDADAIRTVRRRGADRLTTLVAERTGAKLDPSALTVGFARRFATYKRADLLLQPADWLAALLADEERPVQFVFAGKAHPADDEGKALLAAVVAFAATRLRTDGSSSCPTTTWRWLRPCTPGATSGSTIRSDPTRHREPAVRSLPSMEG